MLNETHFENQPEIEKVNNTETSAVNSLLTNFPLISKIVKRGLYYSQNAAEDVSQKVLINLWRWRTKDIDRNLSEEELTKISVRAAQNEVVQFYRSNGKKNQTTDYLEELAVPPSDSAGLVEGNTEKEVNSLAILAWNEVKLLSLRQKYALLLQKQELIFYLVGSRCCQIQEIADDLELSKEKFVEIFQMLPISDERIGEIFYDVTGEKLTPKQIWEARCKARKKLAKVLG